MARPQSLIGQEPDVASFSDRSTNDSLELAYELDCADRFRVQPLPPGKRQKLGRQLRASISGMPCGRGELSDSLIFRTHCTIVDEFEVCRDHSEQVVEVVRDASGELADSLHLLALLELFLDHAARLDSVLVF